MEPKYPRGSEWRKWDLHLHAPGAMAEDRYKASSAEIDALTEFCHALEASDVDVFGITDYFSAENYFRVVKRFKELYPTSAKVFFPNIEFRLEDSNKDSDNINIHVLFSDSAKVSEAKLAKFLTTIKLQNATADNATLFCSKEDLQELGYGNAMVRLESITEALSATFGESGDYLMFAVANGYGGLRPPPHEGRHRELAMIIDEASQVLFGRADDSEFYLTDRYLGSVPKPVVSGSDAHSFQDLAARLGKRYIKKDGEKEIIEHDITWIKADPTFEGLKQIIYEPVSGDRVYIGPVRPGEKQPYKVIESIEFKNTNKFPLKIEFNENLCAIIGSRSSGKSALLAYLAHSVNPTLAESRMQKGPAAGIAWGDVDFDYEIKWANGKTNTQSPGKVIYLPQNYLFDISEKPEEIKRRIEPVLFKRFSEMEGRCATANREIDAANEILSDQIDSWFEQSDNIKGYDDSLKGIGDKSAITAEKERIELKIEELKKESALTQDDLSAFQAVMAAAALMRQRQQQISADLSQIGIAENATGDAANFFKGVSVSTNPSSESLPAALRTILKDRVAAAQKPILSGLNEAVTQHAAALRVEARELVTALDKWLADNADLIKRNEKNAALQSLIAQLNEQIRLLGLIAANEEARTVAVTARGVAETAIQSELQKRQSALERLNLFVKSLDQNDEEIVFGVEYDIDVSEVRALTPSVNTREKSNYLDGQRELNVPLIREKALQFVEAVYMGVQKINAGFEKKSVIKSVLKLTEKILFTASMEGDKIGGFGEPTMTPGKRALFALRLILGEEGETWPLLIDQAEDDLDSRSIYEEIVPFLKKRKRERQIIMVSHNANLVIGPDSEQIIVANRHGNDRPNVDGREFNYYSGSLEFTKAKDKKIKDTLTSQGVREHACQILDGGVDAFEHRRNKYNLTKRSRPLV